MADILANYNEFTPQVQGLDRQRKIAEMLMTQGLQPQQGQMVSGRYVAPSWTQQLAGLANIAAGTYMQEQADTKQQELANALRGLKTSEQKAILEKIKAGDPNAALELATTSQYGAGKEFVPALVKSVIPDDTEMQKNYKTYQKEGGKLNFTDWMDRKDNERLALERQRIALDERRLGLEAANQNKPQIVETANGFVAVNPRNPNQAIPVMIDGKPLMGNKGVLSGEGAKQVVGAKNLNDAIIDYKDKLRNFGGIDLLNPNARTNMQQSYNNMMLQAKEAYNLGVLNGKDWEILQSVVKDPTSFNALTLSKNTLTNQADELSKTANKVIKNTYEIHGKPLPANLTETNLNPPSLKKPTNITRPSSVDETTWNFMTPDEKALFGK